MKDIAPYRQPMVTSLGIMMGFLLNFLANWATADDAAPALQSRADWLVAGTLCLALTLMCFVLYRMLDIRTPDDKLFGTYVVTFRLYMVAIVLAFAGLGLALFF